MRGSVGAEEACDRARSAAESRALPPPPTLFLLLFTHSLTHRLIALCLFDFVIIF